jgi:ABC-2 type transport system permease protein
MKTILKIAKTELALLFYSPIAWFLLIAFLFQCGLAYTGVMEAYLTTQDLGGRGLMGLTFLTSKIFAPNNGIWPGLASKFYLYLPLLTMGLMSREINNGTIKLLYSSPVKVREIIFGKFLAMMLYNGALVLILSLIAVCGVIDIHAADTGLLLSGLLGMYLLLCTYAAIGLFMSCLTSYQVVAALSTLVLLGVLSYVGTLWQDIAFVRDLAHFLSINGRTDHMLMGLITTKDILYFIVITGIFLSFSIYKLQSDRESKPLLVKVGHYALIVVCALAIGYITSRPGVIGYWDTTATKTMTLTVNAQQILKEMGDEPIEVTSYINLLDNHFIFGRPDQRNSDMGRWEPYLRFKPDIQLKYVYYYDSAGDNNLFKYNPGVTMRSLAEKYAKSMKVDLARFKTPAEMHRLIDLRPEQNRYVMQLKYKGRTTFLRIYDDMNVFPTETETAAALKRLMLAKMPKIAFVQGELERRIDKTGDRQYKLLTNQITFRYSLVNQGFDVETLSLKDQDIPGDISALVIADPKVPFDTTALTRIRAYIASGGNLLIAGEPGGQEILNPLLQPLGVQMMDGMVVEQNKNFSPELVQPFLTPAAAAFSRRLGRDAKDSLCLSMRGTVALDYSSNGPFTISPLVVTAEKTSWNKKIKPDEDMLESAEGRIGPVMGNTGRAASGGENTGQRPSWAALAYDPSEGDQKGPLPAVLGLTRSINGKQQRIIVAGDADFLSNSELSRGNLSTCNFDFSTGMFSWFSYGAFPIDSYRPPSRDIRLTVTDSGLSFLKVLLLGILPGLFLVIGAILLIRRKRK